MHWTLAAEPEIPEGGAGAPEAASGIFDKAATFTFGPVHLCQAALRLTHARATRLIQCPL
jgi:hypothetical protein